MALKTAASAAKQLQGMPTSDWGGGPINLNQQAQTPAVKELLIDLNDLVVRPDSGSRLPSDLAKAVWSGKMKFVEAVREWARRDDIKIEIPDDDDEKVAKGHPLAVVMHSTMRSMANIGLIHPIRVIEQANGKYLINAGRRRAIASAMLTIIGAGQGFDKIRVELGDAQLESAVTYDENVARDNVPVTAIERAKQIVDVRFRLTAEANGVAYVPLDWSIYEGKDNPLGLIESEYPDLVPWARVYESMKRSKQYIIKAVTILRQADVVIDAAASSGATENQVRSVIAPSTAVSSTTKAKAIKGKLKVKTVEAVKLRQAVLTVARLLGDGAKIVTIDEPLSDAIDVVATYLKTLKK